MQVLDLLGGDRIEQGAKVGILVECADHDAGPDFAQVDDGRSQQKAEVGIHVPMDVPDLARVHGVDGEHIPVHGNDLTRTDLNRELKGFAHRHITNDSTPSTEKVVLVDGQKRRMNGTLCH